MSSDSAAPGKSVPPRSEAVQPDWTAIMAAMGKNFSEFMTRQQSTLAAHTPLNGSAFPAPEAARFSELHQQWLESQHRLWQAFAQRKPDDGPAPAVVQPDPTDRRANAVSLTPRGKEVVAEVNADVQALRRQVFAGLPDADFEATMRVFAAIKAAASKPSDES